MHIFFYKVNGKWLSLVEHLVWDQGVAGSNPVFPILFLFKRKFYLSPINDGDLAQLGEHLPYKQRVSGSIPLVSIREKAVL